MEINELKERVMSRLLQEITPTLPSTLDEFKEYTSIHFDNIYHVKNDIIISLTAFYKYIWQGKNPMYEFNDSDIMDNRAKIIAVYKPDFNSIEIFQIDRLTWY